MSSPAAPVSQAQAPQAAPDADASRAAFARFAWGGLAYTVGVILFGAVVRITGSGAGCGQHWPTCQGEIVHVPKTLATAIELSHRLTSGLSLVLVIAMAVIAFRRFPVGHATRRAASWSVFFMLTESLVGAALVLLRLVGQNTSAARAAVMAVHLVNTSLLAGAMALTAWSAGHAVRRRLRPACPLEWTLLGGLAGTLVVSVTGAITALGDTLYPVETTRTVAERLAADHGATATFLERGRIVHPAVAFTVAIFLLVLSWKAAEIRPREEVERASRLVIGLVFAQVGAGVVNILLSAPGWMQVMHLGVGTTLWLGLVIFYVSVLSAREPDRAAP